MGYDYTAYMDYIDFDFRCSRKAIKLNHSLTPYLNFRGEHDTQLGNAHTEQSFVYHQQVISLVRVCVIAPSVHSSFYMYVLMLSFYQFYLQLDRYNYIRNLSQSYHDIDAFMYDLYLWMCIYVYIFLCLCILLCNRAPWKNNVTEWFTLYKYIWNKKIKKSDHSYVILTHISEPNTVVFV